MIWVIATLAAWLLPAVLMMCFTLLIAVRKLGFGLLTALRRRQAGEGVRVDERRTLPQ